MTGRGSVAVVSADRSMPTEYVGKVEPNYYCRGWNEKRKKYCGARAGRGTAHSGVGRCRVHGGQKEEGDGRVRSGRYSAILPDRLGDLIERHAADPSPLDVVPELAVARGLMQDYIERYAENAAALRAWYAAGEPITDAQRAALLRCLDELEALYGETEITDQQTEALAEARAGVARLAAPRAEKPRQVLDVSDAVRHADVISKIIHRVNVHNSQNAVSYARLASFMFEVNRELDALVKDPALRRQINARILQVRI